jgi:hypothetical protein
MYESYKKVFEDALDNHDRQWLIEYKGRTITGMHLLYSLDLKPYLVSPL